MSKIKEKNKAKKSIDKRNILLILLMSISFSFTVFFFTPIDVVLNNQADFSANVIDIIKPTLELTLIVAVIFVWLLFLLLSISEKLFMGFARIFLGIFLAAYMQVLFFGSQLNEMNSSKHPEMSRALIIFNAILYILMIILPTALHIIFLIRSKHREKAGQEVGDEDRNGASDSTDPQELGKKAPAFIFAAVFVMQAVGVFSSYIKNDPRKYVRSYQEVLSYSPMMSLSKENNIVVFLIDRLDSRWMDELLEVYPELNEKLDGYTFYQNNISHYTNTFPSVPSMLTGHLYDKEDWNTYLSNAWSNEKNALDVLKNNGYEINLAIDGATTYQSIEQLKGHADNIKELESGEVSMDKMPVVVSMLELSILKVKPYAVNFDSLENVFISMTSEYISSFISDKPEIVPFAISTKSDMCFYNFVHNNSADARNVNKTFNFVHLNGAHDAFREGMDLAPYEYTESSFDKTVQQTARGELEIVFEYTDRLKELGVYDDTTIILVADHGMRPAELVYQDDMEESNVAALLIKPAHSESGPLKIDRDSQLTNDLFQASLLEYAGIDHSDFGYSYNDVIDNDIETERYFETIRFHSYGNEKFLHKYRVVGDARDFSNWTVIE